MALSFKGRRRFAIERLQSIEKNLNIEIFLLFFTGGTAKSCE
jgi:hypothetical protein